MDKTSGGPLAGLRVIDFGHYVAGPGAAMILADQGAEVVRIERPGGPAMPSPANAVYNRGKRNVVLDLKTPEGLAAAVALVDDADVVIENFRPGVMARLGLGYEALRSRNPGSRLPVSTRLLAGRCRECGHSRLGRCHRRRHGPIHGYGPQPRPDGDQTLPIRHLGLGSAYAAIFGAMSVVLALRARGTDGQGDWIEVPLAAALMEGLAYNSMWVEDLPERYKSLRERELDRPTRSWTADEPQLRGPARLSGPVLSYVSLQGRLPHLCRCRVAQHAR